MSDYLTFATDASTFEEIKKNIELLASTELCEYESGWWGIYAQGKSHLANEIKLYPNYVEGEGYHEKDKNISYLLSFSMATDVEKIKEIVSKSMFSFKLIRHETLKST